MRSESTILESLRVIERCIGFYIRRGNRQVNGLNDPSYKFTFDKIFSVNVELREIRFRPYRGHRFYTLLAWDMDRPFELISKEEFDKLPIDGRYA
jgi:hypothetical protein